jgi:hypothetical protein
MDYQKTKQGSALQNETNDCAVKALSIACDVPYHVAHRVLESLGRVKRKGTYRHQTLTAVKLLGFKAESILVSACTVSTLERAPEVQKGYFMATVKRHILAVKNAKVEDWSQGRKHRLQDVFKITPAVSRKERKALAQKWCNI